MSSWTGFAHLPNTSRPWTPRILGPTIHAVREFHPGSGVADPSPNLHSALTWSNSIHRAGTIRRQIPTHPSILFEHDATSIHRTTLAVHNEFHRANAARWEYLRSLRWELRHAPSLDRIQACSRDNGDYLLSFLPELEG
jgi:hypothetical protein